MDKLSKKYNPSSLTGVPQEIGETVFSKYYDLKRPADVSEEEWDDKTCEICYFTPAWLPHVQSDHCNNPFLHLVCSICVEREEVSENCFRCNKPLKPSDKNSDFGFEFNSCYYCGISGLCEICFVPPPKPWTYVDGEHHACQICKLKILELGPSYADEKLQNKKRKRSGSF